MSCMSYMSRMSYMGYKGYMDGIRASSRVVSLM